MNDNIKKSSANRGTNFQIFCKTVFVWLHLQYRRQKLCFDNFRHHGVDAAGLINTKCKKLN